CWHSNGYMTLPVLGHAGSMREWLLLVPIGLYAIFGVGATLVAMGQDGLTDLVAATALGG
ncbi:MAG TPA: metal-dependent hydrolase, partial [Arthrobacter sp.]